MRISLLESNAALAEYLVVALGFAGHTVTLYPSREDLFFALFTEVSLHQRAPYDLLLLEQILDDDGKQVIAELYRLVRDQELPLIVLTTSSHEAITLARAAFPSLCIRQLPLPLRTLLTLIQTQGPSMSSATLPSDR